MSMLNTILKSTNSGKSALLLTEDNLLRMGWKRIPNHEGRDMFYKPDPTKPGGYNDLCCLEYKSMKTPKWFTNFKGEFGYWEEGFYINACTLLYLVKTFDDLKLCENYWNVMNDYDKLFDAKMKYLFAMNGI